MADIVPLPTEAGNYITAAQNRPRAIRLTLEMAGLVAGAGMAIAEMHGWIDSNEVRTAGVAAIAASLGGVGLEAYGVHRFIRRCGQ